MGCSEMILLMVAAAVGTLAAVEGQSSTPSCAMALVPCADYLNSTNPPESCCKPLKQTVETQLECLCNLYNNPGLFASLRINITQALALPKYCGVSGNLSACNNATAPTSVPPPPGVPGDSGAIKMAWTGMSSLLLFWVSMMVY